MSENPGGLIDQERIDIIQEEYREMAGMAEGYWKRVQDFQKEHDALRAELAQMREALEDATYSVGGGVARHMGDCKVYVPQIETGQVDRWRAALALPHSSAAAERWKAMEEGDRIGRLVLKLAFNDSAVELSHNPSDAPEIWCAVPLGGKRCKHETPLGALEAAVLEVAALAALEED